VRNRDVCSAEHLLDKPAQLITIAADGTMLEVWGIAIESLLYFEEILAKNRAVDILLLRNLAAEMFAGVEDELRLNRFDRLCRVIRRKISILDGCWEIYNKMSSPERNSENFELYDLKKWAKKTEANMYPCHWHLWHSPDHVERSGVILGFSDSRFHDYAACDSGRLAGTENRSRPEFFSVSRISLQVTEVLSSRVKSNLTRADNIVLPDRYTLNIYSITKVLCSQPSRLPAQVVSVYKPQR
jgi:hypothetical protein